MVKRITLHSEVAQPIGEHNPPSKLVKTSSIESIIKYDFDYFNPPQGDFLRQFSLKKNFIISIPTSAGKTVVAEIAIAFNSKSKGRSIYMAPLKALAEEKYADWKDPSHPFSSPRYNIGIVTGDHSGGREKTFRENNVLLASYEIIDHYTKFQNKRDSFENVTCLVVDEGHNVGDPGRGPNLEFALMRFANTFPRAQIIFLSASVPNAADVQEWLTTINGKETVVITSDYRPCQLHETKVIFNNQFGSQAMPLSIEAEKRKDAIYSIINKHSGDQGIVFVSNKHFGRLITKSINDDFGIPVAFHSADLDLTERRKIESAFKEKTLKIVVSTPTLAQGVNLPAKYVVISDTKRGAQRVSAKEIQQCAGRAGRPKYDTVGHAYLILRKSDAQSETTRISMDMQLKSALITKEDYALHILSDIMAGRITVTSDLYKIYQQTYAHVCNRQAMSREFCNDILSMLHKCRAIQMNKQFISLAPLGKVSVFYYMHPITIADWFHGFRDIAHLDLSPQTHGKDVSITNDFNVMWTFAGSWEFNPVNPVALRISRADKAFTAMFAQFGTDQEQWRRVAAGGLLKTLWHRVDANTDIVFINTIRQQFKRWTAAMRRIQEMYASTLIQQDPNKFVGWRYPNDEYTILEGRMMYSVDRALIPFVSIKGIGETFAKRIFATGIKHPKDFCDPVNASKLFEIVGKKRATAMLHEIKETYKIEVAGEQHIF